MNRWRSERVERTFAHVCATGGGRRAWLRGLINVQKAHLLRCCACNLGRVMRQCFGLGKPRSGAVAATVILILAAATAYGISGSHLWLGYLPWLILYALVLLLLAAVARNTGSHLRLIQEIRGS